MELFMLLGMFIISFVFECGHYFIPLLFIAITVFCFLKFKKDTNAKSLLVKGIIFAVLSICYIVCSIIVFMDNSNLYYMNPIANWFVYISYGVFVVIIAILFIYKTVKSIINYIRLPKGDKNKKKSLVWFIIWEVITIVYCIAAFFMIVMLVSAPYR